VGRSGIHLTTGAHMDITSALAASGPTERVGKCLLQRRLDSIDDQIEGKGDLIDAIESADWTAPMLAKVFIRLGIGVSLTVIKTHRSGTCTCYLGV
jgi:hypothetical protein